MILDMPNLRRQCDSELPMLVRRTGQGVFRHHHNVIQTGGAGNDVQLVAVISGLTNVQVPVAVQRGRQVLQAQVPAHPAVVLEALAADRAGVQLRVRSANQKVMSEFFLFLFLCRLRTCSPHKCCGLACTERSSLAATISPSRLDTPAPNKILRKCYFLKIKIESY